MKAKPPSMTGQPVAEVSSEREVVLERLIQSGILATELGVSPDLVEVSDEELERTGDMRPGARPSEQLIAEDRGR